MTHPSPALLLALYLCVACGGGPGSGGCDSGTIETCACPDGSSAKRVCTDDRAWTPCACREPDVIVTPDDGRPDVPDLAEPDLPDAFEVDVPPDQPPDLAEAVEDVDVEPLPEPPVAEPEPEPFEIHYPDNCEPQCGARVCGPDGCGGVCGTPALRSLGEGGCACGHECQQGACVWVACDGHECGLDEAGCGVQCGGCYEHPNSQCAVVFSGSQCACQPDCTGKLCGDDGCGGSCGVCQGGSVCNASSTCVPTCTPDCSGKACGPAPCGADCGSCLAGKHCSPQNQCVECLSSADCASPLACLSMACVPVVP